MKARRKRRKELLQWRFEQYSRITSKQLADSFSVEALPDGQFPYRFRKALTEFRHLSQEARKSVCKSFIKALQ